MIQYVAGFLVTPERDVVVLIEKQHPEWQRGRINAVGGKIRPEESPAEAMRREFKEEAGLDIADWRPTVVLLGNDYIVHFFVAFGDTAKAKTMESETIQQYWVEILPDKSLPNIRWILPLSLDPDVQFPLTVRDRSSEGAGQTKADRT